MPVRSRVNQFREINPHLHYQDPFFGVRAVDDREYPLAFERCARRMKGLIWKAARRCPSKT